jgi:hypothetical protein
MREREGQFMVFFVKTFFLVNFLVGSVIYIFTPDRMSPIPEPSTMFLIAITIAILTLVKVLRES